MLYIRFFFIGLLEDRSKILNELFDSEISRIRKTLANNTIPEGVKGKSKAYRKIQARRKELENQISFFAFLKEKNPTHFQINGLDLVAIKYGDQVSVLYGRCLHRGALMADGYIDGPNCLHPGSQIHLQLY